MLASADEPLSGDLFDAGGERLSDHQAERQLLGYLLNRPQAASDVLQILSSVDLFDPFHQRILDAIAASVESGEGISAAAVIQALGGDAKAILYDQVTVGAYFASLVANANLADDVQEIAEHIAACSERRAVGAADDVGFAPGDFISKFGATRWEDIGTGPTQRYEWVVEDIIPKGEQVLVFGDSGSGKSFSIFDMSIHVALGKPFFGKNVEPGLVIYIAAEAGKGFIKRKAGYNVRHNLGDRHVPFVLLTRRPDFFSSDDDCNALIFEIDKIKRSYSEKLVLIVLDTVSASTPGMDENKGRDVSQFRLRLQRLSDAADASIIAVHHKPKNGTTPRGHGSLTGDWETTIEFEVTELRDSDGLSVQRASVRKQREGKKGHVWEFVLPVLTVGTNKWGNPDTTCVAVPFENNNTPKATGWQATKTEMMFLRALFDGLNEVGLDPPRGLPASITKAVHIDEVRTRMKALYIPASQDSSKAETSFRQAFKRAGDGLKEGAVVGFKNPLFWYTGKAVRGLTTWVA